MEGKTHPLELQNVLAGYCGSTSLAEEPWPNDFRGLMECRKSWPPQLSSGCQNPKGRGSNWRPVDVNRSRRRFALRIRSIQYQSSAPNCKKPIPADHCLNGVETAVARRDSQSFRSFPPGRQTRYLDSGLSMPR